MVKKGHQRYKKLDFFPKWSLETQIQVPPKADCFFFVQKSLFKNFLPLPSMNFEFQFQNPIFLDHFFGFEKYLQFVSIPSTPLSQETNNSDRFCFFLCRQCILYKRRQQQDFCYKTIFVFEFTAKTFKTSICFVMSRAFRLAADSLEIDLLFWF